MKGILERWKRRLSWQALLVIGLWNQEGCTWLCWRILRVPHQSLVPTRARLRDTPHQGRSPPGRSQLQFLFSLVETPLTVYTHHFHTIQSVSWIFLRYLSTIFAIILILFKFKLISFSKRHCKQMLIVINSIQRVMSSPPPVLYCINILTLLF